MVKLLYPGTFLFFFFCLFSINSRAQSGCSNCLIELPALPADTIFLSDAPDGETGIYYNGDISFRMPKTTTPVNDPGTPAGLNINKITIVSVVNVPPGLQWQPNKFEFNPQDETDGCVKFCGTPLQPGLYEVEVFVTAEVSILNQSTSFSFPIYVAPASSSTDGFSMLNSSGCGAVTVDFENNVPSEGNAGYSYYWDFGNGNTSLEENPGPQTYDTPGAYAVNYQASIDTFGFQLTTVQVIDAGCYDPISIPPSDAPDLYIKIKNPAGDIIFETSPIDNSPFPTAFNANLFLETGNYKLEVRDDDLIGSQGCGEIIFNRFNLPTDTLVSGDLKVKLNIIHPVSTIQSTDTVWVYEIPADPLIEPTGSVEACEGEIVTLQASYSENLQWHQDSTLLFGETAQELQVQQAGSYWVAYTSPDGCKSQSEPVEVAFIQNPLAPAFHAEGNLLILNNPDGLPSNYSLQWLVDGVEEPGATEIEFCITLPGTAVYTLVVTDETTGCSTDFSLGATYQPDLGCTSDLDEELVWGKELKIFPNPFSQQFTVAFTAVETKEVNMFVTNSLGELVWKKSFETSPGTMEEKLELGDLAGGLYYLFLELEGQTFVKKLVKQ